MTEVSNAKERDRISMRSIRALAKRIADKFQPERIILFGSYAYGEPTLDSDVDLLVVMDTPLRSRQQRLEISRALSPRPFPLDIIVRTPKDLEDRIALGDFFLREITTQGKVIYDRNRKGMGRSARCDQGNADSTRLRAPEAGTSQWSEAMTDFQYEPTLHGWDDEKVYFFDVTGVEWCVSDYPELLTRLVEICQDFFAQQAQARSEDEE